MDAYNRGDFTTAMQQLPPAAEKGDAQAQFLLGEMYASAQGTAQNLPEAMKRLHLSADQGNADAEALLGFLYAAGQGTPQDFAQSLNWSRKAAEQGNADGETNLGSLYANGNGVRQDFNEALGWFEKAAQQHNALAELHLGTLYENGLAVQQDNVQAYKWYALAAAHFVPQMRSKAVEAVNAVAAKMSPDQIAHAKLLAAEDVASAASATSDGGKLDDTIMRQVAERFVKASAKMAPGIWADVQACYKKAASAADKRLETKKCILLDYAGKAIDDGMSNRMVGNQRIHLPNNDWYVQEPFNKRLEQHAPTAFENAAAIPVFVLNNVPPFMAILTETMKQPTKG